MNTFFQIWSLLEPKIEYANLINKCKELWESFTPEKQQEIYLKIEKKKLEKKFVDYNPLLAIRNNALERPKIKEVMSFDDYYKHYKTSEERDGWHMVNPTGQRVIYVRTTGPSRDHLPTTI